VRWNGAFTQMPHSYAPVQGYQMGVYPTDEGQMLVNGTLVGQPQYAASHLAHRVCLDPNTVWMGVSAHNGYAYGQPGFVVSTPAVHYHIPAPRPTRFSQRILAPVTYGLLAPRILPTRNVVHETVREETAQIMTHRGEKPEEASPPTYANIPPPPPPPTAATHPAFKTTTFRPTESHHFRTPPRQKGSSAAPRRNREVERLAAKLWGYLRVGSPLIGAMDSTVIVALGSEPLGSGNLRVADRAAALFLSGHAPLLVCTGGKKGKDGRLKAAEKFGAHFKTTFGVPAHCIVTDSESITAVESCKFVAKLLKKKGIQAKSVLLVSQPHKERRTRGTFWNHWPGEPCPTFFVTSPQITFDEYIKENNITFDDLVNTMVGDLQRLKEWRRKDSMDQEIPEDVLEAWELLVRMNYTSHLIPHFNVEFKHSTPSSSANKVA